METPMRIDPNPRLVWLINYAIEQVAPKLHGKEYAPWLEWASAWKNGRHSPQACVEIARECFANKEPLVWHTLGQLAWGAKEACYSTTKSGWLVIRYIADAMVAFGIAFPDDGFINLPIEQTVASHDRLVTG